MNEEEERKLTIKHQKDTKLEVDNLKEKKNSIDNNNINNNEEEEEGENKYK